MAEPRIRPLTELDVEAVCRIDERITGRYRPDVWEQRIGYYLRRDPDSSQVAEIEGRVVGFMLGEVRGGEFGLEEATGWVEFFGVDPTAREKGIGRRLIEALLGHFRKRGAHVARTMVAARDKDIAAFVAAMGFTQAPLTALEKRL
jgi:ribosomal protein S18 acetylase RimI-like enzyme